MSPSATIESPSSSTLAEYRRGQPLQHIRGLVSAFNKSEDEILGLIESGELLWVFDISLEPSKCRRKELRILPACVVDYQAGRACHLEWKDVEQLITPHNGPLLTGREIEKILNASNAHVAALIRRKLIEHYSTAWTTPGGRVRIPRKSFVEFLNARRFI